MGTVTGAGTGTEAGAETGTGTDTGAGADTGIGADTGTGAGGRAGTGYGAAALPGAAADRPVGELLASFRTLYRQARAASASYRVTGRELKKRKTEARQLRGELARARSRLTESRNAAGRLAREQYRSGSGGLSPFMRAVLSDDPQLALDQRHLMRRMGAVRASAVLRLSGDEARLDELSGKARKAMAEQQKLADRHKRQRDLVGQRFEAVQQMLASLSPYQLDALGVGGAYRTPGAGTGTPDGFSPPAG
ncbi:coiled-coil domain-containing protein [Streptomyces lycii]|uniref:Uncharacterized protein n=1 Tax=Streptomyces lycii TaxID=2654337 RepID=A0ABQ7FGD2_9ACTN|nr:hypothetical protein [Streptomyces lycii]KAF4406896.1 hypothetical protein GCU69_22580 [Streptomyces lycii]